MKKYLFIAEKPSLMRAIKEAYDAVYKDLDYTADFVALRGYFMELKSPEEYDKSWGKPWSKDVLPMIPDKFEYNIKKDTKSDYKVIKDKMERGNYDAIVNACDAGREGQSIFATFFNHTGSKIPTLRLWASDNTVPTLGKALKNLLDTKSPDLLNMEYASLYRMDMDWLTGMNLSRSATLGSGTVVPVGRVMTPTLAMVVNRDLTIANFVPKDYFEIEGEFDGYKGMWYRDVDEDNHFKTQAEADAFVSKLGDKGEVTEVKTDRVVQKAPPLYNLSDLQKDANKAYGFTASDVLGIAQELYEKHKILSYPRTSSRALSKNIAKEIDKHLKAVDVINDIHPFSSMILGDKSRIDSAMNSKKYVDNGKVTDHHALIPTQLKPIMSNLNDKETKIYMLVVKRFVSIFLDPYLTDKTTIVTTVDNENFKTTGSVLIDIGYRKLLGKTKNDDVIPSVTKGQIVNVNALNVLAKQTKPPQHFTDATLLDAMVNAGKFVDDEEMKTVLKVAEGLGTEATRAGIIDKLLKKSKNRDAMMERKGKTIRATQFGIQVVDQVLKGRDILSPELTATWESKLRELEDGKLSPQDFYNQMIEYIKSETKDFIENINVKISNQREKVIVGICPECGKNVLVSDKYYYCENFKGEKDPCGFIFQKKILGKTLNAKAVEKLLNGEPTAKMTLTKKDKTKFDAQLIYNKSQKQITLYYPSGRDATNEVLGKCPDPNCSGNIVDRGHKASCDNEDCDVNISFKIKGGELTVADIKDLLDGKETRDITFVWDAKKKSTGQAKLKLNGKKLSFVFPEKEGKVIGKCPDCKTGDVIGYDNNCKCSNCKMSIFYTIKGATFSEDEIKKILLGEAVEKTFKWNPKSSGKAKMEYKGNKDGGKINFIFPPRNNKK